MAADNNLLTARYGADDAEFQAGIKRMIASTEKMQKTMEKTFDGIAEHIKHATGASEIFHRVLAALTVGALVEFTKSGYESVDATRMLGDRLGISTERMVAFQFAAASSGTSVESLATAVTFMGRAFEAAAHGNKALQAVFDELKINVAEMKTLQPDAAFGRLADALNRVEDSGKRSHFMMELFGRSSMQVDGIVRAGSKGLKEAAEVVERLGLGFNRVDAEKVKAATDTFEKLKAVISAIAAHLAISSAPFLEEVAKRGVEAVESVGGVDKAVEKLVRKAVTGAGYVLDAWRGFEIMLAGCELAGNMLGAGILTVSDIIAKGVLYAIGIVENLAKALGGTFTVAFDYAKQGMLAVESTVATVLQGVGSKLANLLQTVGEAMTSVGMSGGAMVQTLANKIGQYTGTMVADVAKKQDELKAKTKDDTDAMKSMWEHSTDVDLDTGMLDDLMIEYDKTMGESEKKLDALLNAPIPHQAALDALDDIEKKADEAAAHAAAALGQAPGEQTGEKKKPAAVDEAEKARLAAKLAMFQDEVNAEVAAEARGYAAQLTEMNLAFESAGTDQAEQHVILEEMERQHKARLLAIDNSYAASQKRASQNTAEQNIALTSKYLGAAASLMQSHNRKMFEIGKIAAIANAVVSTYQAAAQALKEVPYPFNFVAAATVIAAGFVQVANIKSTSFGGGGGGGGGGGMPAAPAAGATGGAGTNTNTGDSSAASNQAVHIHLNGQGKFSAVDIRDLFDAIAENGGDGLVLRNVKIQTA